MITDKFNSVWPDYFDVMLDIKWSEPLDYEKVFSGVEENDSAYFYAIVAEVNKEWRVFYIGMTYKQNVAKRNSQPDHRLRLQKLNHKYKKLIFCLSLGTPIFKKGKVNKKIIETIEGLLIYSNCNEDIQNYKKTEKFKSDKQIYINNIGWTQHIEQEVAHGVFYRNITSL